MKISFRIPSLQKHGKGSRKIYRGKGFKANGTLYKIKVNVLATEIGTESSNSNPFTCKMLKNTL